MSSTRCCSRASRPTSLRSLRETLCTLLVLRMGRSASNEIKRTTAREQLYSYEWVLRGLCRCPEGMPLTAWRFPRLLQPLERGKLRQNSGLSRTSVRPSRIRDGLQTLLCRQPQHDPAPMPAATGKFIEVELHKGGRNATFWCPANITAGQMVEAFGGSELSALKLYPSGSLLWPSMTLKE